MENTCEFTIENMADINYLHHKEEPYSKNLTETFLPKIEIDDTSKIDSSFESSSEITTSITEQIDSIKSCESVLKIFTFEPKGFNKRNEKCLEFWNLIESQPEIQPVNCIIMDAQRNRRDKECQTELEESEESLWVRALHILMEKKVDKVAMSTSGNVCKFCQFPKDSYESSDNDHLSELDEFDPPCLNIFGKPTLDPIIDSSKESLHKKKEPIIEKESFIKKEQCIRTEILIPPQVLEQTLNVSIRQETVERSEVTNPPSNLSTTYNFTMSQEPEDNVEATSEQINTVPSTDYHTTIKYPSELTLEYLENISVCECVNDEMECLRDTLNEELLNQLSNAAIKLTEMKQSLLDSTDNNWQDKEVMESWKKPPVGGSRGKVVSLPNIKSSKDDDKNKTDEKDGNIKEKRLREGYTYPQHIFSLIGINPKEYKKGTAQMRKQLLQDALKDNYSRLIKKDPEGPTTLPCPCSEELQEKTSSYCTCKSGTCQVPQELDLEDLSEFTKYMPYTSGLECMKIMMNGLKEINKKKLSLEETSNEIRNLLKTIQSRPIDSDQPCQCPLHQIDMDAIEKQLRDEKFVKGMLWERFEKGLDEKYDKKLGVKIVGDIRSEHTQVEEEDIDEGDDGKSKQKKNICDRCGMRNCKCYLDRNDIPFVGVL